eukprot:m.16358 g.16358  ORF g.16358 m.16358 type:complete len:498 (+) comp11005_c0_seq1:287-1780(+)
MSRVRQLGVIAIAAAAVLMMSLLSNESLLHSILFSSIPPTATSPVTYTDVKVIDVGAVTAGIIAENHDRKQLINKLQEQYATIAHNQRQPVIIKNSVLVNWTAFSKWTLQNIVQQLPQLEVYQQQNSREFITFHDNKPLEPFVTQSKWSDFNHLVNVSSQTIFTEDFPAQYFSKDIIKLQSDWPGIMRDVQPLRPLVVQESGVQANLWIGAKGVETYTHYDASWNFFGQIHGSKRFTLFDPSVNLYPYPCLHPHIGHAQAQWRTDNLTALQRHYPLFASSQPIAHVAVLERGDLLYVPPYWWHHVETLAPSVSLNVWSDAPSYITLNTIYQLPIPFESEWSLSRTTIVAATFLNLIFKMLEVAADEYKSTSTSMSFVQTHIISQRWKELVTSNRLSVVDDPDIAKACKCVTSPPNSNEPYPANCDTESGSSDGENGDILFDIIHRTKLEARVNSIIKHFRQIEPQGVLNISLGNYVEHVAMAAVGTKHVYHFLNRCF